jgi:hypothetical protein
VHMHKGLVHLHQRFVHLHKGVVHLHQRFVHLNAIILNGA